MNMNGNMNSQHHHHNNGISASASASANASASASANPPIVSMEGYLVKRSVTTTMGLHTWRKRYFVLDKNMSLSYYRAANGVLKGQILLTADTEVKISDLRPHAFQVHTPYVTIHLQPKDDEERDEWIHEVKRVVKNTASKKDERKWKKLKVASEAVKQGTKTNFGTHIFTASNQEFEVDTRYEFNRVVGQGAYGVVVSARDTKTNTDVAIKKITNVFANAVDGKRILRELTLLRHLRHPNISRILDIMRPHVPKEAVKMGGNIEDNFADVYVVMDLMDTDLHRVIYSTQSLSEQHVQYLMFQLLHACRYLKQANVIHRDLKPSNVLVNAECSLQICDFGLSRGVSADENDQSEQDDTEDDLTVYVVTRWYRAPELLLSCNEYDSAIDLWSVGCIFAELLGRRPLFPGEDYIKQLSLILDTLGSPSEEDLEFVEESAARFVKNMEYRPGMQWKQVPQLTQCSNEALDLLDKLLEFNPKKRISAENALRHPYFKDYANVPLRDSARLNVEDFEGEKMSTKELRLAIMKEIRHYRGDEYAVGRT